MNAHHSVLGWSLIAPVFLGVLAVPCGTSRAMAEEAVSPAGIAQAILAESGIQGGLVVHLGCGDGRLTTALRAHEGFFVHGLDRNPDAVAEAREHVRSLGLYGPVSIEQLHGARLPYTDNLVNLLVVDDPEAVSADEIERVLAP